LTNKEINAIITGNTIIQHTILQLSITQHKLTCIIGINYSVGHINFDASIKNIFSKGHHHLDYRCNLGVISLISK